MTVSCSAGEGDPICTVRCSIVDLLGWQGELRPVLSMNLSGQLRHPTRRVKGWTARGGVLQPSWDEAKAKELNRHPA